MSILNVNQIQPVGSGQTITISASDITASSATITASKITASSGDFTVGTGSSVYSPATNTLALGTNSAERVRITSDGKVSIGGFNPAVAGLSISNSSTNRGLEFDTGSGFDSTSCIRAYDRPTTAYKSLGLTGSDIKFGINDVEKVSITSDGDVVVRGPSNPADYTLSNGIFVQPGNGSSGLTITSGSATDNAYINFSRGTASHTEQFAFAIGRDGTNNQGVVLVDNAVAARFGSTGIVMPSGKGIDFSANSNASGSTSELLDDYEEGTFTPRISVEGQASDATIDNVSGTYVKVGDLVHCTFNADLNGDPAGRGTSFAWQFGGLPFTSRAEGSEGSEDYIGSVRIGGADHTSTYGVAGDFILRLFDNNTGGRIEVMRVSNGAIVNASLYMIDNTSCNGSITYRAL